MGKMNGHMSKRLINNKGRCMLETSNLHTHNEKPNFNVRNMHCNSNFLNDSMM
jgi:hypothetical protein